MALTTRWVTNAGAGAADGTSEANAMSFATFVDYMSTGGSFTATAGDVFQIVGNISSQGATAHAFVNGGSSTSPVVIRGVKTGGTTAYAGRDIAGALITTDFPTIPFTSGSMSLTGNWIVMENIKLTGSAATGGVLRISTGANCVVKSCYVSAAALVVSGAAITPSVICHIIDCDAVLTNGGNAGAAAIIVTGSQNSRILHNRVTSTNGGITVGTAAVVVGNTIYKCGGVGVALTLTTGLATILANSIIGCTGDGIDVVTGTTINHTIGNNCITDNGGYGIDFNSAAVGCTALFFNRFRDNTSGNINLATDSVSATNWSVVTTDTGGSSTDYTDYAGNDFMLISASPAAGAGLPSPASIGAMQRDASGSGGGTRAYGSVS